ncbi:hypothetical protein [Streptomyces sp. NRRL S-350]|uniref:hypothetical protein n=1 Tax=Streptomyces sp. NRRL S-350 TaxID=1463902 RepID=UPI0004C00514|nr:hypothetical protein [Streptomyces sp. NRRL S-350]
MTTTTFEGEKRSFTYRTNDASPITDSEGRDRTPRAVRIGQWTVVTEWCGNNGREPVVIHAVGDTAAAGREDAASQLREMYDDRQELNIGHGDDGDAYIVAMFPGHHAAIQW